MNKKELPMQPAKTEISGSLILLRGEGDYQVLMLKRNARMTFGSMHTFPGGKVDPMDHILAQSIEPISQTYHNQVLQPWYGAALISALRETYEETGMLFRGCTVEQTIHHAHQLLPLLRIITPTHAIKRYDMRRRFDTQFFVATTDSLINRGNPTQLQNLDDLQLTSESQSFIWETPLKLVQMYQRGEISIAPPTLQILLLLDVFKTTSKLTSWIRDRSGTPYEAISLTFPHCFQGLSSGINPFYVFPDHAYDLKEQADEEVSPYLKQEFQHYLNLWDKQRSTLKLQMKMKNGAFSSFHCQASQDVLKSPFGALVNINTAFAPRL